MPTGCIQSPFDPLFLDTEQLVAFVSIGTEAGEGHLADRRASCHDQRACQHVLKLSNVAWPIILCQSIQGFSADLRPTVVQSYRDSGDKALGQSRNIAQPIPQRWKWYCHFRKPVEQVGAESVFSHGLLQILVGHRDDANIGSNQALSSHTVELTTVQSSQKLCLEGGCRISDFIEEERSPVGRLKAPRTTLCCARVGTAFVTKELTFSQRIDDGRAAQGNKRA